MDCEMEFRVIKVLIKYIAQLEAKMIQYEAKKWDCDDFFSKYYWEMKKDHTEAADLLKTFWGFDRID